MIGLHLWISACATEIVKVSSFVSYFCYRITKDVLIFLCNAPLSVGVSHCLCNAEHNTILATWRRVGYLMLVVGFILVLSSGHVYQAISLSGNLKCYELSCTCIILCYSLSQNGKLQGYCRESEFKENEGLTGIPDQSREGLRHYTL